MSLPDPETGLVIHYAYLWRSEADRGEEEGRKDRPCAVVVARRVDSSGMIGVMVAPITHSEPFENSTALEIPADVKRRLGLDDARSWIITHETNTFTWPGPDLRTVPGANERHFAYGHLPKKLAKEMLRRVMMNVQVGRRRSVRRTE
jgi:hypothetical protein